VLATSSVRQLPPPDQIIVVNKNFSLLNSKFSEFVKKTSELFQGIFYLTYGSIELVFGLIQGKKQQPDPKVKSALHWFYRPIAVFYQKITSFSVLHGGCFLGLGVCRLMQGLNQLNVIKLGLVLPTIALTGSSFFIAANVFLLLYSANKFCKYCFLPETASEGQKEEARLQKISYSLAFLSALNQIVGTVLMISGADTALVVLFMALAMTQGVGKIVFDMYL